MTALSHQPLDHFTADGHTWLTVHEAARRLGVTAGRIYHIIWDHRLILHPKPPHGLTYVRADSVEDYRRYREQLRQLQDHPAGLGVREDALLRLCPLCLGALGLGAVVLYPDPRAAGAGARRQICGACAREVLLALPPRILRTPAKRKVVV